MDNFCIKVKRKGFNYYSDYMERYFDKTAACYGYNLVNNPEQAEHSCITIINTPDMGSGGSPWMIFWSKAFDEIPHEKLQEVSQAIAEHFKSESIIEKFNISEIIEAIKNGSREYGMPYPWFFSKEHNAFEEPPFLTEGATKLKAVSYNTSCESDNIFLITFQNFGGISKGIKINISFSSAEDSVDLEELGLVIPKDKHESRFIPIESQKADIERMLTYTIELPNFAVPEGINAYSAKLCGKKKQVEYNLRSFSLRFMPKGNNDILKTIQIEVIPLEYPEGKILWKY